MGVLDAADDVQVAEGWFDHQDVRPLLHVERHLAQRLAGVGGVHLVRPAVSELRRALGRVPERTVES